MTPAPVSFQLSRKHYVGSCEILHNPRFWHLGEPERSHYERTRKKYCDHSRFANLLAFFLYIMKEILRNQNSAAVNLLWYVSEYVFLKCVINLIILLKIMYYVYIYHGKRHASLQWDSFNIYKLLQHFICMGSMPTK